MPVESEFSAGGVVVRDGACVVIVPTRRALRTDSGKIDTPNPAATRLKRSRCGASCTILGVNPAPWHIAIS